MPHKRMLSIRKTSVIILFNFVFLIILFLIVEGLSSTIINARKAFFEDLITERRHTQYDEEIGWINLPSLSINMYGGKSFTTNAMSFRNDKDFSFSVPSNKVRVICSGDSFTMGYGVGNEDVWCKLLESIDTRIETVNLGQGGYGVDQAYLWYKRNSFKLEHNIHIFAFITADFDRMQSDTFRGYGKPFLVLQDNVLININKPVPKRSYLIPRLPVIQKYYSQLSSVILKRTLFQEDPSLALKKKNQKDNQIQEVVAKIIENLQKINKAKNSSLVLMHLPVKSDYMGHRSERWQHFLHAEAVKHDIIYIDLIDEFRKYPPQEVETLFIRQHYSAKGNSYIANIMYEKLLSIPEIAYKFQEK